jgi:hypothetical protein
MSSGTKSGAAVEAWRPGAVSMIHVALGFGVLVCAAMSVVTLGL